MKKLNFSRKIDTKNGWENVDRDNFEFNQFPYKIKDNIYDYIYLNEVLEHLIYPDKVLKELHRISKKSAIIEIIVPHYTNKGAYGSLQHQHYFNECAFEEFLQYNPNLFKLVELKLIPTKIGKYFPPYLRRKIGLFVNGLYSQIHIRLKVEK